MATVTIPWNDGNGNITLTYTGQGDGTVTVQSSTDNLGQPRSQVITLKTTGENPATATVTIIQPTGRKLLLSGQYHKLVSADNHELWVLPTPTSQLISSQEHQLVSSDGHGLVAFTDENNN